MHQQRGNELVRGQDHNDAEATRGGADVVMYRVVSAMFDRERLLTGSRSRTARPSRASG